MIVALVALLPQPASAAEETVSPLPPDIGYDVAVMKVSGGASPRPLAGARLQLLDDEGAEVAMLTTSDADQTDLSGLVELGKSYVLHEAEAPRGYSLAEDVRFTVGTDGVSIEGWGAMEKGDVILMVDYALPGMMISKWDEAGEELAGASLRLVDATTGETVDEWTSSDVPHEIPGELLCAGHGYELREELAPAGYEELGPVAFRLDGKGDVQDVSGSDATFDEEERLLVVTNERVPETSPPADPEPEPDPEPDPEPEPMPEETPEPEEKPDPAEPTDPAEPDVDPEPELDVPADTTTASFAKPSPLADTSSGDALPQTGNGSPIAIAALGGAGAVLTAAGVVARRRHRG